MRDPDALRRLFREIAIIDDALRARLARVLPAGLPEAQFGLLNHLVYTTNRDETPSDLARAFHVSRPAMTQILARMKTRGLVELRPSAEDGRVRHVHLTAAGRSTHDEVFAALDGDFGALAGRVAPAEIDALFTALHAFRLHVEATPGPGSVAPGSVSVASGSVSVASGDQGVDP